MTTIKDVAEYANVAISTVSRVINNQDKVSDKTKGKILEAIKILNYHPNMVAQNLKRKQTNTLGIILENISIPHSTSLIKGLDNVARKANQNLFLCDGDSSQEKIIKHLEILSSRQVDGIILSSSIKMDNALENAIKKILSLEIPLVMVSMESKELSVTSVRNSTEMQGKASIEYLMRLGHKRIAIIGHNSDSYVTNGNVKMYKKIMKENGIYDENLMCFCEYVYDDKKIKYNEFILESSAKFTRKLINMNNPPTAIYALGDLLLLGVLLGIKEENLQIPKDVSVFSCLTSDFLTKPYMDLTHISVPCFELGQIAMEKLIEQIKESKLSGKEEILVNSKIVEGESCMAI